MEGGKPAKWGGAETTTALLWKKLPLKIRAAPNLVGIACTGAVAVCYIHTWAGVLACECEYRVPLYK